MSDRGVSPLKTWQTFTKEEKRNILCHIIALVFVKFGIEAYHGSVFALATNRYDYEAARAGSAPKTFQRVGLISALGHAAHVIGSNLIGPLLPIWPLKRFLLLSMVMIMLCSTLLLIVDAATGGRIKPKGWHEQHGWNNFAYFGSYNTDIIMPIIFVEGIFNGLGSTVVKVLPQQILGTELHRLQRLNALIHVFYELASTAGSFCTALVLIPSLGTNFAFLTTPICVLIASCAWACMVGPPASKSVLVDKEGRPEQMGLKATLKRFVLVPKSFWLGAKIICSSRRFIWLLPSAGINLYGHIYIERSLVHVIARRYLGAAEWAQIMAGGCTFGEALGALFILLFPNLITTPLPWLRLDSLMFLVMWYLPFWSPPSGAMRYAWVVAATFMPMSIGWGAADVTLSAYIQANVGSKEGVQPENISEIGAALGFLNTVTIATYAIASPFLGQYIDTVYAATGAAFGRGTVRPAIFNVAGVQYTALMAVGLASTFLPRGAFKFNPKTLNGDQPGDREKPVIEDDRADTS